MTSFSISLPNEVDHIIIQSSNGLLLLRPRNRSESENYHLYVHNPATKQSRKIIPTPSTTHPLVFGAGLAFDPSKAPYYDLVFIRQSVDRWSPLSYQIEVYSSKSHTWKELITLGPSTLPSGMRMSVASVWPYNKVIVYWNNAMYWTPVSGNFYCCFDIAKGEMKPLRFPVSPDHLRDEKGYVYCQHENGQAYSRLQETNGHLYHVELMGSDGGYELVAVWELSEDHHWLLRHHRVLPPPPKCEWWNWERPSMLTFWVDTCSLLICQNGWKGIYNLNFGRYEYFLDPTGQPFFLAGRQEHLYVMAFQFGGTLALV